MKAGISIRYVTMGFLAGVMALVAFAWFFGPKISRHQEDPLTGRSRYTTEWLGATIHTRVVENETSRWADQNSISGVYPGQYGWVGVSATGRRWCGKTVIGCGGGYGVVQLIFHGAIKLDGGSREETLQKYQTELIENWKEHSSLLPAIKEWSRGTRHTNMIASPAVQ